MTTFIARILGTEEATLSFLNGDIYIDTIHNLFETIGIRLSMCVDGFTGRPVDVFKAFTKLLLAENVIKAKTYKKRRCPRGMIKSRKRRK
jgi:hypothetical protein